MKRTRLDLHEKLCSILGSRNVYFQPPENVKLRYPCFVYSFNAGDEKRADNQRYGFTRRYQVTYITTKADDPMRESFGDYFPVCRYGSDFTSDNLHHSIFDLYF